MQRLQKYEWQHLWVESLKLREKELKVVRKSLNLIIVHGKYKKIKIDGTGPSLKKHLSLYYSVEQNVLSKREANKERNKTNCKNSWKNNKGNYKTLILFIVIVSFLIFNIVILNKYIKRIEKHDKIFISKVIPISKFDRMSIL